MTITVGIVIAVILFSLLSVRYVRPRKACVAPRVSLFVDLEEEVEVDAEDEAYSIRYGQYIYHNFYAEALGRIQQLERDENLTLRESGTNHNRTYKLYRPGSLTPSLVLYPERALFDGGKALTFTVHDRAIMGSAKTAGRWLKNRLGAQSLEIDKAYMA